MTVQEPRGVTEDPIVVSDLAIEFPPHGASPTVEALRGVSFRVGRGEVLGLLGSSGSGKSTLAAVLAGRHLIGDFGSIRPVISGGAAVVEGHRLRGLSRRGLSRLTYEVGYVPQNAGDGLRPDLTVSELIAEPIYQRDKRFDRTGASVRAATLLDVVHLPLLVLDRFPYELSSGQRQRVALARALVLDPMILVADEPTAGIDITVRESIVETVRYLSTATGLTSVLVSHDPAVVFGGTDRVAILDEGSLIGLGPVRDVLATSDHPYVRRLAVSLDAPSAS